MQTFFESEKRSLIFFSLLWIVAVIFVNPIGEFPLNDDGLYSHWPLSLMEGTNNDLQGALAPNLILQALWGYFFCELFDGFSFTALRFSTLFLGWMCIFIIFFGAKRQLQNKNLALLITTLFVFNPVFFSMSHTFMTDVPFLALAIPCIWMYGSFIEKKEQRFRVFALIFGILAFLIRQPGILLIVIFELGIFLLNKKTRWNLIGLLGSCGLGILVYLGVEIFVKDWLGIKEAYIPVTTGFFNQLINEPTIFVFQLCKRTLMTVFHIGLFSLPLFLPVYRVLKRSKLLTIKWLLPIVAFNIAVIVALSKIEYYFPYGGNIFYNWGLGPVLFNDVYNLKTTKLPQIPIEIIMGFGLVCQVYGCYLLLFLSKKVWKMVKNPVDHQFLLILLFFNCCYLGAMLIYNFFDRYLLLPFLTVLLLLIPELKFKDRFNKVFVTAFFVVFGIFAVVGTRDYMNWNRATQKAWTSLEKKGISMEDIDCGLAFNQFYKKDPYDNAEPYIIAMGEVSGYEKQDSFSFVRNLFLSKGEIYILKRKTNQ